MNKVKIDWLQLTMFKTKYFKKMSYPVIVSIKDALSFRRDTQVLNYSEIVM